MLITKPDKCCIRKRANQSHLLIIIQKILNRILATVPTTHLNNIYVKC